MPAEGWPRVAALTSSYAFSELVFVVGGLRQRSVTLEYPVLVFGSRLVMISRAWVSRTLSRGWATATVCVSCSFRAWVQFRVSADVKTL